jgi:hypothetical protein
LARVKIFEASKFFVLEVLPCQGGNIAANEYCIVSTLSQKTKLRRQYKNIF